MMLRPRNYGSLNRAVARSLTYALRDYNRKGNKRSNVSNVNNNNDGDVSFNVMWIFVIIFIFMLVVR